MVICESSMNQARITSIPNAISLRSRFQRFACKFRMRNKALPLAKFAMNIEEISESSFVMPYHTRFILRPSAAAKMAET
jgi:hypothetical protein